MTKKIKTLDQAPVDVVEAVKRGIIHRGLIPRKYQRNDPLSPEFILDNEEPDNNNNKGDSKPTNNSASQPDGLQDSTKRQKVPKKNRPKQDHAQKFDTEEAQEILNKNTHHQNPRLKKIDDDTTSQGDMGGSNPKGATYKDDSDKAGQMESQEKPSEGLGTSEGGRKPVKPQNQGDNGPTTVEDEQRAEKPEGGEGGTAKDWPPQNLRNDITSTDPDISVIDSEKGSQEAAKDPNEPEPGRIHEKLIDITEKAHDVLFAADTVFPFTPFPHTITLDREKLTIAIRYFFRVAKIITVPITSMISAEADVGPFFGTVRMTSKYFVDNTHAIRYLWRHDATEIHRLLQGFIIAHERDLELHEIDKDDLKTLLCDLGQGVSD